MLKKERHESILNQLDLNGRVIVSELAQDFKVSEDLIRKDLKVLEKVGLLDRVYGGATKITNYERSNVYERIEKDIPKKTIMAQKAYDLIENGETIFLDISTTNLILAKLLSESNKKVIVISNMIDVLKILSINKNLTVIGTGGNVNLELNGFVGSITIDMINHYIFTKSFLGTTGIDRDTNLLTTFDMVDGLVKKAIIQNSKKTYVFIEDQKFNQMGNYRYSSLQEVDFVISNHYNLDVLTYLKELNITMI